MMDVMKVDYAISTTLATIRQKYAAINLHAIKKNESFLQRNLLEFFEKFCQLGKEANCVIDLQNALKNYEMFTIDTEIDVEIDQWVNKLLENLKENDVAAHVDTYLCLYNKNYFDLFSNKVSLDSIISIWSASTILVDKKRRYIAMLILYALTKAFADDQSLFLDELQSIETYFIVRNYLIYGDALDLLLYSVDLDDGSMQPNEFFELEKLKSLFTAQEAMLLPELKAITAAGGFAQSIEREDLEGAKKKKNKKTVKKRYNRIEKLEED